MKQSPWLIVSGDFHRKGGMDRANFALAEYIASQGIQVFLVTHYADPALSSNPLIKVKLVPRPTGSVTLSSPLLDYWGRFMAAKIKSRYAEAKIVSNGASCIWRGVNWAHYIHHAWCPTTPATLRGACTNVVQAFHRNREKAAYQKARLILANSNVTRQQLLRHFRLDPGIVRTLYLGSEASWRQINPCEREFARSSLNIPTTRKIALFVGAIGRDRRKGFDTLVDAWRVLCEDPDWDVDLLIAGAGDTGRLKGQVNTLGLKDRIRILGFSDKVFELLAAADLLVSPSRYEAYGLNVQEAICRGLPAMVSASAGIAERYPKDLSDMLIDDPEDLNALVICLRRWQKDVPQWFLRFEPFSKHLRSYTWENMARDFVILAESIKDEPSRAA